MNRNVPIIIPELPVTKHNSPVYRDGWISAMLCGKSGCGKTRLAAELIPGISNVIRFICIATMVRDNPFHLAIEEWARKTKRICVTSSSPESIRSFIEYLHEKKLLVPGEQELLVIFDDFSIHNRTGSKHENLVVEAFTRWRNLGVNFIVICQDATMVAPSCRNCTNMRALFSSASKSALQAFNKDVIDRVADPEAYRDLVRYITSVPFSYIMVQENPLEISVGKGATMRKVMTEDEVIIPTYDTLMSELGAGSPSELKQISSELQKKIGNTAPQLNRSQGPTLYRSRQDDDDDTSDSGSD